MNKLSVVINTWNEEQNLPHALKSIKGFADEVVIVDTESTDNTLKIAKKHGARTYKFRNVGYVEPARNFAIEKTKFEWVLILDADEVISQSLGKKIKKIIQSSKGDYYALPRKNIVFGKWMRNSRWWPDYNIRLFKKGHVKWMDDIHSVPITNGKGMDLKPIGKFAIVHNNYSSVDQYIERLNRYTSIQAREKVEIGYELDWKDLIHKPTSEFLSRYFVGKGYKDGLHGFVLALLQSFSELIVYVKVWQEKGFKDRSLDVKDVVSEIKIARKDENYWFADTFLQLSGGNLQRIKRKFRLP